MNKIINFIHTHTPIFYTSTCFFSTTDMSSYDAAAPTVSVDCPSPDKKKRSSETTTTPTLATQLFLQQLPEEMLILTLEFLTAFEVGNNVMNRCTSFHQAGLYRLKTPMRIGTDASSLQTGTDALSLAQALIQITTLRTKGIYIRKILLSPGDHTLPPVQQEEACQNFDCKYKLEINLNNIEIEGTLVLPVAVPSTSTSTLSSAAAPLPVQDILLKHRSKNVYDLDDGTRNSPLQTRVRGQIYIKGSNVVLKHLDLMCENDSAVICSLNTKAKVINSAIHHCGRSGLVAKDKANLLIEKCVVSDCSDDGLKADDESTVTIRSSFFVGNYDGVWCRKSAICEMKNSMVFNNEGVGLRAGTGLITHQGCHIFDNSKSNIETAPGGNIEGTYKERPAEDQMPTM